MVAALLGTDTVVSASLQQTSSVVRQQVDTEPLDADIDTMVLDDRRRNLLYTTYGPPGSVIRVDLRSLSRTALVLQPDDGRVVGSALDWPRDQLILVTDTSPARVLRIDLVTFARTGALTLLPGETYFYAVTLDSGAAILYAATFLPADSQMHGTIVRVDVAAFVRLGALTLPENHTRLYARLLDDYGGFVYFGEHTDRGRIARVRLSDFSYAGSLEVAQFGAGLMDIQLDRASATLLALSTSSIGDSGPLPKLHRIRLSDFTLIHSVPLDRTCAAAATMALDAMAGALYVTCQMQYSVVVKVRLSDLAQVGLLPFSVGETNAGPSLIDFTAGDLWVGTFASPGQLIRVRLSDFQRSTVLQQFPSESLGFLLTALLDDTALYVVGGGAPATVARLRLPHYAFERQLTLSDGEMGMYSGLLHSAQGFMLLPSRAGLLRLRTTDLARDGTLPLAPPALLRAFNQPIDVFAAAWGSGLSVAYFGLFSAPGCVVSVDTATFTVRKAVLLPDGMEFISGCIYDSTTAALFCIFYSSTAGQVAKLRGSDLSVRSIYETVQPYASLITPGPPGFAFVLTQNAPVIVTLLHLPTMAAAWRQMPSRYDVVAAGVYDPAADHLLVVASTLPAVTLGVLNGSTLQLQRNIDIGHSASRYMLMNYATGDALLIRANSPPGVVNIPRARPADADSHMMQVYVAESFLRIGFIFLGHAFFAGGDRIGVLSRVRLSDFSYAGSLLLSTVEQISCAVQVGWHGYFGSFTLPGAIFKVDLYGFALEDSLLFDDYAGADLLRCIVSHGDDPLRPTLYVGMYLQPAGILQIVVSGTGAGSMSLKTHLTLPAGVENLVAAVVVGDLAFFVTDTVPPRLVRMQLETAVEPFGLISVDVLTDANGGATSALLHEASGTLFVGLSTVPARVVAWDLGAYSLLPKAAMLDTQEVSIGDLVICPTDGRLFATTSTLSATVAVLDTATLSRLGTLKLTEYNRPFRALLCDSDAGVVYMVTLGSAPDVFAVNATTVEVLDVMDLAPGAGEGWLRAGAVFRSPQLVAHDEFGVAPSSAATADVPFVVYATFPAPGTVIKVQLHNMQVVETLTLGTGEYRFATAVVDPLGVYAYLLTDGVTIVKVRVNVAPMRRVAQLNLRAFEYRLRSAHITRDGAWLLVITATYPSTVIVVALSTFTRNASAALGLGDDAAACSILDVDEHNLYVANSAPASRIVRVGLWPLQRVAFLDLPPSVRYVTSAAVDSARGIGYFGAGTKPGLVAVVQLVPLALLRVLTLQAGEVSVRLLVSDVSAGYLYAATDRAPSTIVQFSLTGNNTRVSSVLLPVSGRPSSMSLEATEGWLVTATDTVPSQIMQLDATPAQPVIQGAQTMSADGTLLLVPLATLCASVPHGSGLCVFAAPKLLFSGRFFGSFLSIERAAAALFAFSAARVGSGGVWSPQSTVGLEANCTSLQCTDGSHCMCSLSLRSAGSILATPGLTAVSYQAALTVGTAVSAPFAVALLFGAPALLRSSPAAITQRNTKVTIDAALDCTFSAGTDELALVSESLAVPCSAVAVESIDGQILSCVPPPLSGRLLGHSFDLHLRRSNATVARLSSAVQYAWPILGIVEPTDGLLPTPVNGVRGSPLALQSAALAMALTDGRAADVAVWIGTSLCTDLSIVSAVSGAVRCFAPAGIGEDVSVVVQVSDTTAGSGASVFNVTSFESVPFGAPMSLYDGQLSFAPTPPRTGMRTVVSYATPTVLSFEPAAVLLRRPYAHAHHLNVSIALSAPISPEVVSSTLLLGHEANQTGVPCDGVVEVSFSVTVVCSVPVATIVQLVAPAGVDLIGAVQLQLRLRLQVPAWPFSTAVTAPFPALLAVYGRPVVTDIQPPSVREGTRISLLGTALAPGSSAPVVSVGGSACTDAIVMSDGRLECTVPAYNASAAVGDAVQVYVTTECGQSSPALFRYANQLSIAWGPDVSGAATPTVLQLPGLMPLFPVPSLHIALGDAVQCALAVQTIQPAGLTAWLVGTTSRLLHLDGSIAAPQTIVFPEVSVVASSLAPFTVYITATCRDVAGFVARTPVAASWTFGAPTAEWHSATLAATSNLLAASATNVPPVLLTGCLPAAVDNSTAHRTWNDVVACSASVVHGGIVVSSTSLAPASVVEYTANEQCAFVSFEGLSLASVPFGSNASLQASCTWLPTGDVLLLQSLTLRMLPVVPGWDVTPPATTESQTLLRPAPTIRLSALVAARDVPAAMESIVLACTISAALAAAVSGSSPSTSTFVDSAAVTSSIVVPQTVSGAWNSTLTFDAFSVAGRRLSVYNVTVACQLGEQALPVLSHPLSIAGCPPGTEPGGSTGWLCNECPVGAYSDGGAMACRSCPAVGAACTSGELQLQTGFFLASAAPAAVNFDVGTELHPCFNSEACTLNVTQRQYGCSRGYGGPLCGVCQTGYTLFGEACAECWPAWSSTLLVLGIAATLLVAVAWLALFHKPGTRSPASIALRQLVGFLQMLSIVSAFRQQTAGLARSVLGWTDAANASLLSFGPLGCLFSLSFLSRFALTVGLPIAFGVAVAAVAWLKQQHACARYTADRAGTGKAAARQRLQETASSVPDESASSGPPHTALARGNTPATARRSSPFPEAATVPNTSLTERLVSVLLLLTSLLYMPLLTACLRALDCYERPVDGVTYLRADLRVVCNTGQHAAAQVLAMVVLAVLGFGFPGFILLRLCRHSRSNRLSRCCSETTGAVRNSSTATTATRETTLPAVWRPLYDGYDVQRGTLWWEAVVLLRKAVLAVVGTFMGSSSQGIPALAVVLLASIALQESVHPYEEPAFNWGERVALGGAVAAAVLATLYTQSAGTTDPGNMAITVTIGVVSFAVLLALTAQWLRAMRSSAAGVHAQAQAVLRKLSSRVASRKRVLTSSRNTMRAASAGTLGAGLAKSTGNSSGAEAPSTLPAAQQ